MSDRAVSAQSTAEDSADETVLFVDDEPDLLEVYEAVYGHEYDVMTAASGTEALRKMHEDVDFVFTDRRMPDMTGTDVLDAIREAGYRTPVGMLSAVDPERNPPGDVATYITKPAEKSQIVSAIDRHSN